MNRPFVSPTLAISLGLFPLAASAAPLAYSPNDLLIGFRATAGLGATTCYVINVGPVATYRDATTPITVTGLGNIAADLTATYGAGWQARTDVNWGAACTPGPETAIAPDPAATVYLSRSQTSPTNPPTAPIIDSEPLRIGVANRIDALQRSFYDTVVNPTLPDTTGNSDFGVLRPSDANYAWRTYMASGSPIPTNTPGTTDFGAGINIETAPANRLALFRLKDNAAGSYEGYFTISAAGELVFTPAVSINYSTWAASNAITGDDADPQDDFDHDGLQNGVEFFMGTDGKAYTAAPTLEGNTITWPRAAGRSVTSYEVQTSETLANGSWTVVSSGSGTGSGNVSYTQAPGTVGAPPAKFVRLVVNP